jgi:chromosome segregation ATPase
MNSSDRLDRIEAILVATAVQQQANTEALTRLEALTFANSTAIDRLTERVDRIAVQQQANTEAIGRLEVQTQANATAIDRLTERFDQLTDRVDRLAQRFDGLVSAIQSHQEALRLISQQHNEWREQMRIIQTEIRDIWQYLNNQLRNRGNGGGQN